jgi:predicted nucleic acid-binding Zn finger protein
LYQYYYAKTLLREGLVKVVKITNRLKIFKVTNTKGDEYEVMINNKGYNCTCEFGSLWSGGSKDCCHIKAVKMLEGEYGS